ncbi:hypothetical protein H4W30_000905 [Amycolatopsis roodepoortensis]|uniref:Uncharacterized protein n=1 Tax=Amycolatopsis roodepoortensis TaxID=700274 RepID=A0ABR9KZU3_9PSEU|nr:hypothetical protein [Amycolatopsis roodepoortensis]
MAAAGRASQAKVLGAKVCSTALSGEYDSWTKFFDP